MKFDSLSNIKFQEFIPSKMEAHFSLSEQGLMINAIAFKDGFDHLNAQILESFSILQSTVNKITYAKTIKVCHTG